MNQRIGQQESSSGNFEGAIKAGAHSRLRPVLMTALITAPGLFPLLLSNAVGSEIQRPLAGLVIGGLISSTSLTLLVISVLDSGYSRRWLESKFRP